MSCGNVDELRGKHYVARGVDARVRCAQSGIDDRRAAFVDSDLSSRKIERVGIRETSSGHEHGVGIKCLFVLPLGHEEAYA